MAKNLIQTVQDNLGIQPLKKVDPNTQDVKANAATTVTATHTVEQAALPAVLAGLYKFSTTQQGAETILSGNSDDWTGSIFSGNTSDIVQHIADYAEVSTEEAYQKMEWIAKEAVSVIRNNVKDQSAPDSVANYLFGERKEILTYLPAEVHAGDWLNDNTIDDRTNKMEGPMSNMMKKIANLFTSSEGPKDNTHQF